MPAHVVVVGAGVIGLSTAGQLARRGHRVTVLDAGRPGGGTSSTSMAYLNANSKLPREYFELNAAGMAAHRRRLAEMGSAPWLRLTGHLVWVAPGSDEERALAEQDARLRSWGYAVATLTAAEARRTEPDLVIEADQVTLYSDEGFVFPALFVGHLLRVAEAAGVQVRPLSRVVGFTGDGGPVAGVVLESGEHIAADVVVLCGGRWTGELAAMAGSRVPLEPAAAGSPALGLLGYTAPLPVMLDRYVSTPGLGFRPDGGGRLVLQANDLEPSLRLDAPLPLDAGPGAELLRRAAGRIRGLDGARLEALRIGVRPLPADGHSIVGWAPDAERLYVVVTHSGMTLSLLLGELAANEITTGAEEALLRRFRPDRFPG